MQSQQEEEKQHKTITLNEIRQARGRIEGFAYRTPAFESFSVKNAVLKLECFQPVRSFKIRGASNKILLIPEKERRERGVITASSGNHGMAVAYVANKLGIKATIVLPENVIQDKFEIIKSLGAETVLFGRQQDERSRKAEEIQNKEGQIFVQAFNDLEIVAGQGTCGLELLEQVSDIQEVYVPIGGGGLLSGIAAALKLCKSKARVIGVQPEGSPSMYESWKKNELSSIEKSNTIADGLSVRRPGDITYNLVKRYVDDIMLVSDEEILSTTKRIIQREHVLVEPSGAAAFAALIKARKKEQYDEKNKGKTVAIVSGGNISQKVLETLLRAPKED